MRLAKLRSLVDRFVAPGQSPAGESAEVDEGPLRGHYLGSEALESRARELASQFTVARNSRRRADRFFGRFERNIGILRTAYHVLAEDVRAGRSVSPAEEWLLDNFHLIDSEALEIQRYLPRRYYRELPAVATADFDGIPRVYAMAVELIRASDGLLDLERITRFVGAYQTVTPLTIGELWAWPSMLRLGLVENLRRIAETILEARDAEQRADADFDHFERGGLDHRAPEISSAEPTAYVAQLLRRLWEYGSRVAQLRARLDEQLATHHVTAEDAVRAEHQEQAAAQVSIGNSITSLRLCSTQDWSRFFEDVSLVDEVLRRDPAGVYQKMDFATRDRYRRSIEELAERTGEAQRAAALRVVEASRRSAERSASDPREAHVGWRLIGRGRREFESVINFRPRLRQRARRFFFRHAVFFYLVTIGGLTGGLVALATWAVRGSGYEWLVSALALIPATELAIAWVQSVAAGVARPRLAPRLDLSTGVPDEGVTMVIIPTLLTSPDGVRRMIDHLEVQALGNMDPNVHFGILGDFADADVEQLPSDLEILRVAREGIDELNARHGEGRGGRFYFFHRARLWNEKQNRWMGWERKRGKLEEFNRLLRGAEDTSYREQIGDLSILPRIKYCLTLDSDTRLPRDAARKLIGIMLHPLNRPHFDPRLGRVTDGYGILQPRISVTLSSAVGSFFSRLYAGAIGVDPYTTAVSDTYQDLFAEGSYSGKGIYDVDAFLLALGDRVPENALLSHDLFEGLYARTALVSDVELVDDYPSSVIAHMRRLHRWVRGDWQILLWLFPWAPSSTGIERNRLPILSRWKILDNLRRSVVAPASLALIVAGWTVLPGRPIVWTAAALLSLSFAVLAQLERFLAGPAARQPVQVFLRNAAEDLATATAQTFLTVTFLPYQSYRMLHAIAVTLVRMVITHRRLLEWDTAASVISRASQLTGRRALAAFGMELSSSPIFALGCGLVVATARPGAFFIAAPFLLLWAAAPVVAAWLSRPVSTTRHPPREADRPLLRRIARRTWHFFETFLRPEDNWLPPDNFQERGEERLARRTSPTNIGMSLVSALAAHDFGFIGTPELVERVERTLRTVEGLERHEGHVLNWISTATLAPLYPRYVSTVDSGNFAACLLAVAQGLRQIAVDPQTPGVRREGLIDTVYFVRRMVDAAISVSTAGSGPTGAAALFAALHSVEQLLFAQMDPGDEASRLASLAPSLRQARLRLAGDEVALLAQPRELRRALFAVERLEASLAPAAVESDLEARLEYAARRAESLAHGMDFRFLFDPRRQQFSTGYRLADSEGPGRLDPTHYDLLASEARTASFFAIAKGDAPVAHWFRLGRQLVASRGRPTLVSWSASMFEYLMPSLLLRSYPGTLLERSCRRAVEHQIHFARRLGVPWGISESAYDFVDHQGDYQYRAFGVPGLGLKRGLGDDLVIAPYATALAAMIDPDGASANFRRLMRAGVQGDYGFFEAIDYTPRDSYDSPLHGDAIHRPTKGVIVRAFFSHHQGMSLVALANVLFESRMVERFHADPHIQATEMLLQEMVNRSAMVSRPRSAEASHSTPASAAGSVRRFRSANTLYPQATFLSNGSFTTVITNSGAGASICRGFALTRWREDPTRDVGSQFLYLRDVRSGAVWSATAQPMAREPQEYEATFLSDRAIFRRRDEEIESQLEVAVSPQEDLEVRRLTLVNRGDRTREIEVTSYVEFALSPPADDLSHPAFGKLFLETSYVAESAAILCSRRPRSERDIGGVAFHVSALEGSAQEPVEWETDRARFLGRGRGVEDPIALTGRPLSGTTGAVLDPIASLRHRVRLAPGGVVRLAFATGFAPNAETAHVLADRYHDPAAASQAFALGFSSSEIELRHLGLTAQEAQLYMSLASAVLYTDASLRAPGDWIARNALAQTALWRFGISGDAPILLIEVTEDDDLPLVRQALRAHEFWRLRGLTADIVILNEHPIGYREEMQSELTMLLEGGRWSAQRDRPGGVFLLRGDGIADAERTLLFAVARAVLRGADGTLEEQLQRPHREPLWPGPFTPRIHPESTTTVLPSSQRSARPTLRFDNGLGGFSADGREYVIVLDGGEETPLPWSNILANPGFGALVSSAGAATTWGENSREARLTPFANDPVSDPTSEAIFLRDEETGQTWGATPAPLPRDPDLRWTVRHGAGWSSFGAAPTGLGQELEIFVHPDESVKYSLLTLRNDGPRTRRVALFVYVEWLLGPGRAGDCLHVVTEYDAETGVIFAQNRYATETTARTGFLAVSQAVVSATGDRAEFIGRNRSLSRPAALERVGLSGRFGGGLDPCGALLLAVEIPPSETREIAIVLGEGVSPEAARAAARRHASVEQAKAALAAVTERWDRILGAVQVRTPDDSLDLLVNRWLLYQCVASRLWARSGYYQSGGAYGFRDQLQDVLSLVYTRPDLCREHLLRAASRQFTEGDVQHWWHPPSGRGVRTRCSDDLLWLPFAVAAYVERTGDHAVLDAPAPFLSAPPLTPEQLETYDLPAVSSEVGSLYEHCVRAIDRGSTAGSHGLPLIGTGDWNDGMNRVGRGGEGESVWLGWFLATILGQFAPICAARGDTARADRYRAERARLAERLELAWDGDWYRRAYYDDGTPLGSASSSEAKIDAIAQSWAVISGLAPPERAERAMDSLRVHLLRRSAQLSLLLTPPFDGSPQDPGYIKGYIPGIRENGGQYTHAALWTVQAMARMGEGDEAVELLHMSNPINRARTAEGMRRYRVEPYVVAADIYAHPLHVGRGGWTWYTGSAGWMYRIALEEILGFQQRGDRLRIDPCIPMNWPDFSIDWTFGGTRYEIEVQNPAKRSQGVARAELDGVRVDASAVPLEDDGRTHRLLVLLGDLETVVEPDQTGELVAQPHIRERQQPVRRHEEVTGDVDLESDGEIDVVPRGGLLRDPEARQIGLSDDRR